MDELLLELVQSLGRIRRKMKILAEMEQELSARVKVLMGPPREFVMYGQVLADVVRRRKWCFDQGGFREHNPSLFDAFVVERCFDVVRVYPKALVGLKKPLTDPVVVHVDGKRVYHPRSLAYDTSSFDASCVSDPLSSSDLSEGV